MKKKDAMKDEIIWNPPRSCGKMICNNCGDFEEHISFQSNRYNYFKCTVCGMIIQIPLNHTAQGYIDNSIEREELKTYPELLTKLLEGNMNENL